MYRGIFGTVGRRRDAVSPSRVEPSAVIFASLCLSRRYDVRKIFNGTQDYATVALLDRLNESLDVLTRDNSTIDGHNNKIYTYALMDWRDAGWEPILAVVELHQRLLIQQLRPSSVAFFNVEGPDLPSCDVDADCAGEHARKTRY